MSECKPCHHEWDTVSAVSFKSIRLMTCSHRILLLKQGALSSIAREDDLLPKLGGRGPALEPADEARPLSFASAPPDRAFSALDLSLSPEKENGQARKEEEQAGGMERPQKQKMTGAQKSWQDKRNLKDFQVAFQCCSQNILLMHSSI